MLICWWLPCPKDICCWWQVSLMRRLVHSLRSLSAMSKGSIQIVHYTSSWQYCLICKRCWKIASVLQVILPICLKPIITLASGLLWTSDDLDFPNAKIDLCLILWGEWHQELQSGGRNSWQAPLWEGDNQTHKFSSLSSPQMARAHHVERMCHFKFISSIS